MLKVFLRIIHKIIFQRIEERIGNTQMGLSKDLEIREDINVIAQRSLDLNQNIYFICFQKPFHTVHHEQLIKILNRKIIDHRDLIIANLFWNQSAKVKVENELTNEIEICLSIRQRCILSPILLNPYSEIIFGEALMDVLW